MPPKKKKTDNTARLELKRALSEGGLKPLYVFYGEEAFLRDSYLHKLRQTLLPAGMEDFNHHTARGKECSVDWLEQAVDYLPVMSGHTLVEVTDFDLFSQPEKSRNRLMDIFSNLPGYCTLVFVYDLLPYKAPGNTKLGSVVKQAGSIVEFQLQEERTLVSWITGQFKKAGKTIDPAGAGYLVFLCGSAMHNLSSQIGKIAAYAPNARVTRADIDAVAIPVSSAVVYKLSDALAARDFDKAAELLADLLHKQENPTDILGYMGKYFRQLYSARLLLEQKRSGELAGLWGLADWQASRLNGAAQKYSLPWCRYAVRRCVEVDAAVKSAPREQKGDVLTAFLMELASGRRVAG